jgi:hypothetical protein
MLVSDLAGTAFGESCVQQAGLTLYRHVVPVFKPVRDLNPHFPVPDVAPAMNCACCSQDSLFSHQPALPT